ncbi:M48 family metalloprotease [Nocardia terpenica]|uniref:M48 family metalloprotease n=1 Tax=Nocardia terpenica TaxID=455432 RepID=UPI002FE28FC4
MLLLLFIILDSLSLLSGLVETLRGEDWKWFELCNLAVGHDPMQPFWTAEVLRYQGFVSSCEKSHGIQPPIVVMAVAAAAVFVVALATYLLWPVWRRRRGRLPTIDVNASDELARQLRDLVGVADLRKTPQFLIDPRADSVSAVVFGRLGRYSVCLDAGLVARGAADPGVLRTVVLHELAHIRNRDVDITYATVALWRSFLFCAVLPTVIDTAVVTVTHTEIWRAEWQLELRGFIRIAVLIALTYLVRADILRTREFYADVDAAYIAGTEAFSQRGERPGTRFAGWRRFVGLWRTHPAWPERNRSLTDPAIVFGATALPMFLTGVTAQLASIEFSLAFDSFGVSTVADRAQEVSVWLTAALVVGIAGYVLWRAVGYAVLTGRRVPSGWGAGMWLGAGLAVGELLSFRTAGAELLPADPELLLLLVISGPVFTWWVTQCAELWIRGCRGRSTRVVQIVGLAAALVVFGTWYDFWMGGPFLFLYGPLRLPGLTLPGLPAWYSIITDLANTPMVFVGAAVLWLFPLLAVVRKPLRRIPEWAARAGAAPPGDAAIAWGAVSMRRAGITAVLGGLLCWSAVVLVMVSLHPGQPPGRLTPEWIFAYPMWLTTALWSAMALTALTVSATTRGNRLLVALAGAGGAGLIGLVGLFLLAAIDGCVPSMRVMAHTCVWRPQAAWEVVTLQVPFVSGLGIDVAAVGALLGAALAEGVRRFAGRRLGSTPPQAISGPLPESIMLRRLVVGGACGSVIALGINLGINYYDQGNPELWDPGAVSLGHEPVHPVAVRSEVSAWLDVGGRDKLHQFAGSLQQWGAASGAAARAAEQAGLPTVPIDPAVFVPTCAAVVRSANDGSAFIPVPDVESQRLWAKSITAGARAGTDCQRSIHDKNDDLFNTSLTEGLDASSAYRALLAHLNTFEQQDGR